MIDTEFNVYSDAKGGDRLSGSRIRLFSIS